MIVRPPVGRSCAPAQDCRKSAPAGVPAVVVVVRVRVTIQAKSCTAPQGRVVPVPGGGFGVNLWSGDSVV